MRHSLHAGLAVVLAAILARPAEAEMSVYNHVGSWDAFTGPGSDGRMICGVGTTNPGDNRSFSLRFTIGADSVQFQAKKPTWNIPAGTEVPVVMQVGLNSPWSAQGTGNGQMIEYSLDRTAMQTFDAQFRAASSMTISFPTGNEPPWTVGLNGSTAISNTFGRCVTDLTQRAGVQPSVPAGPTQPFGQTAVPAGPPQPFGQLPTQPLAPEATQPVQPR
jgi:hypothetical protein